MAGETTMTIIGNLTADPELRFTPAGAAVASFTVASTPRTYDKQAGEWKDGEGLFMRCRLRLKQRSFETREGEKRTVIEMEVEDVGPSLRYATASVTKASHSYSSNGASQGAPVLAAAGGGYGGSYDDEPPW